MTRSLNGKVAIVTGASRGNGRAIAEKLAENGASVVVSYATNEDAAREVVEGIASKGGDAIAVQSDAGGIESVRRLVTTTSERFGRLDVLVNNAGVYSSRPLSEYTERDFDDFFAVHARGPFVGMQEATKRMGDGGRIINISSVSATMSPPGSSLYAGSKAALEQFTKVLAREVGNRNITVNAIAPGFTDTDALRDNHGGELDYLAQMSPMGRLGQPRDIADVVAFLASDEARWITGQVIHVNGGVA